MLTSCIQWCKHIYSCITVLILQVWNHPVITRNHLREMTVLAKKRIRKKRKRKRRKNDWTEVLGLVERERSVNFKCNINIAKFVPCFTAEPYDWTCRNELREAFTILVVSATCHGMKATPCFTCCLLHVKRHCFQFMGVGRSHVLGCRSGLLKLYNLSLIIERCWMFYLGQINSME